MTDRAAALLEDVLRAPASLAAALDGFGAAPAIDPASPLRFVGLGSSRFAAQTVAAALRSAGRVAHVEYASATPSPPAAGEIVLAISSSGRTRETVEVARQLARQVTTLAVTNDPGSPLASVTDACLSIQAGLEAAGMATLSYRATVAVLALATGVATLDELRTAPALIADLLDRRAAWIDDAADVLDGAPGIDVIAEAGRLGSAEQAALVLREAPRLRAEAREAGDWLHTAVYTALPGSRAILLGPTPYDEELTSTIAGRGGKVVLVGFRGAAGVAVELGLHGTGGPGPIVRTLVESVVFDLLAATLWTRAGLKRA